MQLCRACTSLRRAEIDAALIAGASDVEVARRFGLKRAAIQRHRVRHLIQPMRDRIALLTRDSEEQRQRQQLAQAVAEGELSTEALVAAHLGLRAQTKKLSRIEDRLEREAAHAEDIHHLLRALPLVARRPGLLCDKASHTNQEARYDKQDTNSKK